MYINVEVAFLHVMKSQMFHDIMITCIRDCGDLMQILGGLELTSELQLASPRTLQTFLLMSSCPFIGNQSLLKQWPDLSITNFCATLE